MVDQGLTIGYCGEVYDLCPGDELTFGRAADLVVDDANPFMHRTVGRFRHSGGCWWVDNLGRHLELVVDHVTGTRSHLSPRPDDGPAPTTAVPPPSFRVSFAAGGFNYELLGEVAGSHPTEAVPHDDEDLGETLRFGRVRLTDEERAMVEALATPLLRDPTAGPDSLPSNRAVASTLGWTPVKYNRKLDHLCRRLSKAGVPGLVGARGVEAANRRWILVRHAVDSRMVTRSGSDA